MCKCKARVAAAATVMVAICSFTPLAHAQATRTWVSGVGDDANPCSRTAPCKTFAGAISRTATAGEINTIDPGGFGAVTITKSMTIDGTAGIAGVLATLGSNGIIVNAAGAVVILRNLDINGVGTGARGILILAAADVHVENCKIFGFATRGIEDQRTSGKLLVTDTIVSNTGQTGILALASGSSLKVTLDRVRMHNNGNAGFAITGGAQATVTNSSASSNVHGFYADTGAVLNLDNSTAFANTGTGINSYTGAEVRMFSTTVTGNGTGLGASGGSILSYGSNRIAGNGIGNGPPTGTIAVQ
jgi:hypothetical protein